MALLNASVITIGDELLIGQTIDTNSAYIAKVFNEAGIWVKRRVAVGDVFEDIWKALDEETTHSSIIILTGGLGPTADDITKPLLCEYFGGKLVLNPEVLHHIETLFSHVFRRKGPLLKRNIMQAEVPDNCIVLHNAVGTAPGMWFEKENASGNKTVYVSLPGVPHEMKGLIQNQVLPRLLKTYPVGTIVHKTLFTAGMGESAVAELLQDFENHLPSHIKLAYLPSFGMVKLRLTASGENRESTEQEVSDHYSKLIELVKDILVSESDDPMKVVVGKKLVALNKTVATAESCTGGNIAHLLTTVPGASAYFKGSVVSYANETKKNLLKVAEHTLQTQGAVSEATVIEMVQGALAALHTDYALATSGIMGPDGGTAEKPTGTVWIAAGNHKKVATLQLHLRFNRERNIEVASVQALNFLRKFLTENP